MRIFGKITGLDKLDRKWNKFQKEVLAGQVQAMQEATLLVHETAVKLIQDNSDGTPAKRNGRTVNVSKPGDPPNTDTGRLAQSIKFDFQKNGLVGRVGTNLKYGAWLEFGTERIAARPWLSLSLVLVRNAAAELFAKYLKGSVKEAGK